MSRKSQNHAAADADAAEAGAAISNAQAVRDAMAAGLEALDDIDAFVRDRYGKEIPRQQISAYKSQARRRAGEAPRRGRSHGDVEGYLAPPPRQATDGDLIEALQALKPLVAKVGAENVKKLADLLS